MNRPLLATLALLLLPAWAAAQNALVSPRTLAPAEPFQ
jgi:hypothetical protein